MPAIASLSLNLETKTAKWSKGLKSASAEAESFYSKMNRVAASSLGPLADAARGLALGIAGVGAAAAAAGVAIVSSGLDRIDALSDAAQRLGVTTEALSELRHVANLTGSSAEDLDAALEKLNANLGDAALKATPTTEALARIGLDARELAGLPLDVAFKRIVAGFERIPTASGKASAAMDVFGKGGLKIANTLSAGSGAVEELSAQARALGLSVSSLDASKVGATKDQLDVAAASLEGLANTFTIALTPAIVAAAGEFTKFSAAVGAGGGDADGAVDGLVVGFANVATALEDVGSLWRGFQNAATVAIGKVLGLAGDLNAALFGLVPVLGPVLGDGLREFAKGMEAEGDAANKALDKSLAGATAGEKILARFAKARADLANPPAKPAGPASAGDGAMAKLADSVEKVTASLKDQADAFGKTAAEASIFKLAQMGATDAQLAGARASAKKLAGLEAQKKADDELKDSAKGYLESTRTSAEKLTTELGKIAKAKDAGLIDGDTATRAADKAKGEAGMGEPARFAGAARLGSAEAYSAIVAATSGRGGDTGIKDVAKSSQKVATNSDTLVALFGRVADFLAKPPPTIPI